MTKGMGTNYVVLRTHARISDLLDKQQMKRLADAVNIDEFIERLKETPYGEIDVEHNDKIALNLEKVFIKKFTERIEEIVKITPASMGEFLHAYFDFRFEILNIKRILRGKFTESSAEEIDESLIPIEPYIVRDYSELVGADSLEEVVMKLSGTSYETLIEKLELYKEYDALWPLELELNYIYARNILRLTEKLPSSDRRIVNSLVKYETDVENVLIAMKRRGKENLDMDSFFPVTYGINLVELRAFIEEESLIKAIDNLKEPYRSVLEPIKRGDIALVRAMLRKGKYDAATKARAGNQFGFNVILAFLVYSEIEKDNLVGLAWGEVQGLSSDQLLKYIVIPWD
jgi:vacuolar-type H+-ATPase subunit C/Vma6